MNKVFSTQYSTLTDVAVVILRIVISVMMLIYGIPKLQMLLSGEITAPSVLGMSPKLSLISMVFGQVFCSIFLLLGLATRLVVVPLLITMLVAVVVIHDGDPFVVTAPSLHFLLVYVVLLLSGGGKFSLDYLINRNLIQNSNK